MLKKIGIILFLLGTPSFLFAQLTLGTTGLLNAPSAEMQRDKTVMLGGNFLNETLTPTTFSYHTFNYFLNVTILPFMEVAYTCTLLKATDEFVPEKKGRFVNQDRSFSLRLRVLRERKYIPAVVIGGNDLFSSVDNKVFSTGNQYFSRVYLAASKKFEIGKEAVSVHAAYIYTQRKEGNNSGVSVGMSYVPSFAKTLNIIAEYDSRQFNVGANYLLFNHLFLQAMLQKGKYFSGGLAYKIYLK